MALTAAKYFDKMGYNWKRNKERFRYIKPDGKYGFYTPDFYISDFDRYIEIKGYETELDNCKWSQFTKTLVIWKKDKLETLNLI